MKMNIMGLVCISLLATGATFAAQSAPDDARLNAKIEFARGEMLLRNREVPPLAELDFGKVYDFSRGAGIGAGEYTTLFIGSRKSEVSEADFIRRISAHVHHFDEQLREYGLTGYVVSIDGDFEIAWQTWKSRSASEEAFRTEAAQSIVLDASGFMDSAYFSEMK